MNNFDWHKWTPKSYDTSVKINKALEKIGVQGKNIKRINTIGLAHNLLKWAYTQNIRTTLSKVGVPFEDIDNGIYPYIDATILPREVEICEPVVIVFEDNTTLELKPKNGNELQMASNQISSTVINGTNNSNYNPNVFFNDILGSQIQYVQVIRNIKVSSSTSSYEEKRSNITFQFHLSGDWGFFIQQSWEGWFTFGITDQHWFSDLGNMTAGISYSSIKQSILNKRQVVIVEGHDGSSYFWISPIKETDNKNNEVEEYNIEEISIEENDIQEFLYFFLIKYFDKNFPHSDYRDGCSGNDFEWYLEHNVYTYDTIKKMLDDIDDCRKLLETEFDNPKLNELKKHFSCFTFDPDDNRYEKKLTEKEKNDIIKNNIYIATDFYERFTWRMRNMIENAPEYNLISFMGP